MGYREFAKDYEIQYENCPGRKRPKAVRVYVGPWFRFKAPPEKVRFLRWFYLVGMAISFLGILIPLCIDCAFTRIWYIQVPAVAALIPWVFAACATWRLWTAGEKVNREHNHLLGGRMSGACLFMMGFSGISAIGCIYTLTSQGAFGLDYLVCACSLLATVSGIALFSRRKSLDMEMID